MSKGMFEKRESQITTLTNENKQLEEEVKQRSLKIEEFWGREAELEQQLELYKKTIDEIEKLYYELEDVWDEKTNDGIDVFHRIKQILQQLKDKN